MGRDGGDLGKLPERRYDGVVTGEESEERVPAENVRADRARRPDEQPQGRRGPHMALHSGSIHATLRSSASPVMDWHKRGQIAQRTESAPAGSGTGIADVGVCVHEQAVNAVPEFGLRFGAGTGRYGEYSDAFRTWQCCLRKQLRSGTLAAGWAETSFSGSMP